VIERNVLEWRLDPASSAPPPQAATTCVIIMCSEGYTSSLAATALRDLGLRRATDLDGGFCAWAAATFRSSRPASPTTADGPLAAAAHPRSRRPARPPWRLPLLRRLRRGRLPWPLRGAAVARGRAVAVAGYSSDS
jgi:hypothetical protein